MKETLTFGTIILSLMLIVYFGYWAAKTISYVIFYEDMVQGTIREMVMPRALK